MSLPRPDFGQACTSSGVGSVLLGLSARQSSLCSNNQRLLVQKVRLLVQQRGQSPLSESAHPGLLCALPTDHLRDNGDSITWRIIIHAVFVKSSGTSANMGQPVDDNNIWVYQTATTLVTADQIPAPIQHHTCPIHCSTSAAAQYL